jgi:hypothetical protein
VAAEYVDLHLREPAIFLLENGIALVVHVVPDVCQAAVNGDVDVRGGLPPRPLDAAGVGADGGFGLLALLGEHLEIPARAKPSAREELASRAWAIPFG